MSGVSSQEDAFGNAEDSDDGSLGMNRKISQQYVTPIGTLPLPLLTG